MVLVAIAAVGFIGCKKTSASKVIETHRAGDIEITFLNDTGTLSQGNDDFMIEFKSASNGRLVDAGRVVLTSTMPMAGMAPMSADIKLTPTGETGRYHAKGNFPMSGTWRFSIQQDGPAGRTTTTFSESVQ